MELLEGTNAELADFQMTLLQFYTRPGPDVTMLSARHQYCFLCWPLLRGYL